MEEELYEPEDIQDEYEDEDSNPFWSQFSDEALERMGIISYPDSNYIGDGESAIMNSLMSGCGDVFGF